MPLFSFGLPDTDQRRWRWQVLCLLVGFVLLLSSIYLYYTYKIRQLEQQQRQLIQPQP